ncbi:Ribosomal L22 [Spironucleus salmonicida]|uniref:Large ribosomal subunit protein eL22 n=1 Tax=Spironucleus salmonicida TaxID=348837 RepID=V6LNH3_9EUKA|nr:Ribosomal L22 [Spironucleus salmonicida]|eukprot:EST46217.1 Ribosomal L22 [Spironucleus salmonicida]
MNTYFIDFTEAVETAQIDVNHFVDFLKTQMRVNRHKAVLAKCCTIVVEGNKVTITPKEDFDFTKRYAKYLARKYINTTNEGTYRNIFRILENGKLGYKLVNCAIEEDEEAQE